MNSLQPFYSSTFGFDQLFFYIESWIKWSNIFLLNCSLYREPKYRLTYHLACNNCSLSSNDSLDREDDVARESWEDEGAAGGGSKGNSSLNQYFTIKWLMQFLVFLFFRGILTQVAWHLFLARKKKKNLLDGSASSTAAAWSIAAASVYMSTTESTNRAAIRFFSI